MNSDDLFLMSCFGGAFAGMNQFNPMSIGNVQMPQAPMGPRAASPMNHPVQMNNMSAVPAVRTFCYHVLLKIGWLHLAVLTLFWKGHVME